ncbi:hypothetical protein JAAARDRAFT_200339 [Jaapia argillacea MUCL 33604]|uniref:Glycoside hydrolase 131 catalytic N-terminal domain-containing protein n=1 Tax=Jaapia argillacea MUCL 33604 TaxID=933084 RepID=A0A067P5G9_9AGAM|nr:hypothetical protein JAAARDRAFT_200339 [Jaapia argillacea MUCL 33604]
MSTSSKYLLAVLGALAPLAVVAQTTAPGISCPVLFDGRISYTTQPTDFDKNTSLYNPSYNLGQNQTWDQVISFPPMVPSLFDIPSRTKSFEVTINDQSIFLPGGAPLEVGFRRSELMPATNNGTDATVQGTTTFHWSMRTDLFKPLNYSHEYHPIWHETADYSDSEFTLTLGTPFNASFDPTVHVPKTLRLAGRQSVSPETTFFQVPFDDTVWHNWAVTIGWTTNTLSVWYSTDYEPLQLVAGPSFNNNTGGGDFHVGLMKEPTGPLGIDVVHAGYQESGINEGLIYGGVFIENSANGCVTTSPYTSF